MKLPPLNQSISYNVSGSPSSETEQSLVDRYSTKKQVYQQAEKSCFPNPMVLFELHL